MNDRIKNKIYKALRKYHTDCCTGIIRGVNSPERKVIIVRIFSKGGYDINFIGDTGINLLEYCYGNVLYVRDLEDIAFNTAIFG